MSIQLIDNYADTDDNDADANDINDDADDEIADAVTPSSKSRSYTRRSVVPRRVIFNLIPHKVSFPGCLKERSTWTMFSS